MTYKIPEEVLQIGLELHEVIEAQTSFASTQKAAMITFNDHGGLQFLKAVLKYKSDLAAKELIEKGSK
jgi:hypothetical protein